MYLAKPAPLPTHPVPPPPKRPTSSSPPGDPVLNLLMNAAQSSAAGVFTKSQVVSAFVGEASSRVKDVAANFVAAGLDPAQVASQPAIVQATGDLATALSMITAYSSNVSIYFNSISSVSSTSPVSQIRAAAIQSGSLTANISDVINAANNAANSVTKLVTGMNAFFASVANQYTPQKSSPTIADAIGGAIGGTLGGRSTGTAILNASNASTQVVDYGSGAPGSISIAQTKQNSDALAARLTTLASYMQSDPQALSAMASSAQQAGTALLAHLA